MYYWTGDDITEIQANTGVFFWELHPLYFLVKENINQPFQHNYNCLTVEMRFNYNLHRALGLHKCWLYFKIWTHLQPLTSGFHDFFRLNVLSFLRNFGVISINSEIQSIIHFVRRFNRYVIDVQNSAHVQFNLY